MKKSLHSGDCMIGIDIPGGESLRLEHLVLDYNGTLAVDGEIVAGVVRMLNALSQRLQVHVVTADTFGASAPTWRKPPARCMSSRSSSRTAETGLHQELGQRRRGLRGERKKRPFDARRGGCRHRSDSTRGRLCQNPGKADIVCTDILSALELLTHHKRIQATLRT